MGNSAAAGFGEEEGFFVDGSVLIEALTCIISRPGMPSQPREQWAARLQR